MSSAGVSGKKQGANSTNGPGCSWTSLTGTVTLTTVLGSLYGTPSKSLIGAVPVVSTRRTTVLLRQPPKKAIRQAAIRMVAVLLTFFTPRIQNHRVEDRYAS